MHQMNSTMMRTMLIELIDISFVFFSFDVRLDIQIDIRKKKKTKLCIVCSIVFILSLTYLNISCRY